MAVGNKLIIVLVLSVVAVFVVGFVIGYFASPSDNDSNVEDTNTQVNNTDKPASKTDRFEQHKKLYDSLNASKLREYLRSYTDQPHLAGTKIQLEYGEKIKNEWESYGEIFDKVEAFPYKVLLSYMEQGETNIVQLLNSTSEEVLEDFTGVNKNNPDNNTAMVPPMLGFAKPGNATGRLLYVNYGREIDFNTLKTKYSTNCSGYIVIMRYGNGYRGNKIDLAAKCGAVGAILYNDPEDSAPLGENETYPKTWWLPPSGVQRGNLRLVKGDPLTPEWPAIDHIYRMKTDQVNMPQIPATPLPYEQAKELLKLINGTEAPSDWQGGLGFKYKIGENKKGPLVTVQVNAKLQQRNVTNIIGTIIGKEEPDRWVLIGAHRDAWSDGAVDSSCGTAILMELARGLNIMVKSGWRPRRTIKLCSWSAEEQGLIGSTEWVEQQSKIIRERAVAYINIDAVVRGNYTLSSKGSPLLKQLMFEESKKVNDPRDDSKEKKVTLYERWNKVRPGGSGSPKFGALGSGSDYVPFYQFLGVPSIAFDYSFKDLNVTFYPVYHTKYDTFAWMETFVDPNFQIHLSMCELSARVLLRLADSPSLPMKARDYSSALVKSMNSFNTSALSSSSDPLTFDHIKKAILQFNKTARIFDEKLKKLNTTEFSRLRILNNQVSNLEKIFINPYGLPGRSDTRNIIFAPSIVNSYGSASFPGIGDQLSTKPTNWVEVKKQLNILYKSVLEANEFLKPVEKEEH